MKNRSIWVIIFAPFFLILAGCVNSSPHREFVKTVTFSSLQTFHYEHTLIVGANWKGTDRILLEKVSGKAVRDVLQSKGFEDSSNEGDFFVVVKWRKALGPTPTIANHVDGPSEFFRNRDGPGKGFASRVSLSVEVYETDGEEAFWISDKPYVFDAIQLSESRAEDSIKAALANFPDRIERDPSLPNIE